ncbi:hypothetical protein HS125_19030 [bacterium]|nr:hypothetical protein [bacterium]
MSAWPTCSPSLAERHEGASARASPAFIASSEALGQVLAATSADIVFCGDPRLLERLAFEGKLLPDSRRDLRQPAGGSRREGGGVPSPQLRSWPVLKSRALR